MTNHPYKGRGQSHVIRRFFKFCPYHIFVLVKLSTYKFRVLIDTMEYECVRDILLLIGMCSQSRDLFKFGEISDNSPETVQDRDIVAM